MKRQSTDQGKIFANHYLIKDLDLKYTKNPWGTWMAQSVKCPTPDLSSGFDLRVVSSSHTLGPKIDTKNS